MFCNCSSFCPIFPSFSRLAGVKLSLYEYPPYLKDLARHKLEDSERLSVFAKLQLPRVRQACAFCIFLLFSILHICANKIVSVCSQTGPGEGAVHEDVHRALPYSPTPGGDTDGCGHQEVRPL